MELNLGLVQVCGHGTVNKVILWGYINDKGNIICEPKYYELSHFNDEGYAYGILLVESEGYDGSYRIETDQHDERALKEWEILSESYGRKKGIYYKIDKNGKEELISANEYYENINIKKNRQDEDIKLKKNVDRKIYIEYILEESIFPLILAMLSLIIIKKIIKKDEKKI